MFSSIPTVTRAILIANVVAFLLEMNLGPVIVEPFALWPFGSSRFAPWQVVTYGFLHEGATHLFFNMLGVFMFGGQLERVWGERRYAIYYLVCILVAALAQLVTTAVTGELYPTIGASGGVFGLLLAFAMYFPRQPVMLLFPPIPMPAWLFVTLYAAIELVLGVTGTAAGVAHFAHLGGMLGGYLMIRYWRGRGPFNRRGR